MTDEYLEEAINSLESGSAICFIGAGFSAAPNNTPGGAPPSVDVLTDEICELAGVERAEGASLTDLADYCQEDNNLASKLVKLLIDRLTRCVPTSTQAKILQAPWRSIFTTNFDDIPEQALADRKLEIITPVSDARSIVGDKLPIYYMHGRALDILERKGDPRLVLSESNYLELRQRNPVLHSVFINELHCANKVFFIGYSLRDIEIASRLFAISETLASKSVVICGPNEGPVARARLAKFGHVYPIGFEGLASKLRLKSDAGGSSSSDKSFTFVRHIKPQPPSENIIRDDVDRLIISGEFDYSKFAAQATTTDDQFIYCVDRKARVDEIFDGAARSINRFIVSSDIGNGKTTFLKQLSYAAHSRGYEVIQVESHLTEVFRELEILLARKVRQIFIIDDLIRNREAAKFIGARLSGLSMLVCATRDVIDDERYGDLSSILGSATREIDLNTLNDSELKNWERLLERWGYWEGRISLSESERFKFLRDNCGRENRSIVVSIFKSSRIAEKINTIVAYFLRSSPEHTRAFAAILICSLCQKHVEWEKVVQWLGINERALRSEMQKQNVFDFMSSRRDWYRLTSSQLADHIFKNFEFDEEILVDVYVRIVRETAYCADDRRSGFDAGENLKELMKYRFLTRIFGDGVKAPSSVEAIYRRLSAVPRIRLNDQFWLQYGMSSMERGNIGDAETYLNTALGIAEKKGLDYSNHQILDQRVRLLLFKNATALGKPNVSELATALGDLEALLKRASVDRVYPLRAAVFILQFVEAKIDDLDGSLKQRLITILDVMRQMLGTGKLEKSKKGEAEKIGKAIRDADLVLKNA